jgi:hypothetical protein
MAVRQFVRSLGIVSAATIGWWAIWFVLAVWLKSASPQEPTSPTCESELAQLRSTVDVLRASRDQAEQLAANLHARLKQMLDAQAKQEKGGEPNSTGSEKR